MLMKNIRLLGGAACIAALVIGAYTLRHNVINPSDNNAGPANQRTEPARLAKSAGNKASATVPNTRNAEQRSPTTYDGPAIEYPDYVKTTDNSLYGDNAPVYKAYDNNTLKTLAEGGDVLAMKVLVHRLGKNPPPYDPTLGEAENHRRSTEYLQQIHRYTELPVVYGDMEMLDRVTEQSIDYDPRDPKQVRRATLERLAYLEFAAMRGLQSRKYGLAPILIQIYGEQLGAPITLTDDDKTYIRQKAQDIYNDLEAKRNALGLGPFKDIEEPHFSGLDPFQDYIKAMGDNAF